MQVSFTYSGNDLTQVKNSLGRTLTLTNASGRVTNVSDGTRSVGYAYDASGNLATFTDATAKATTFQYDLPGRMTKFFLPANPTVAQVTNVYDTLERVQTQTSAHESVTIIRNAGQPDMEVVVREQGKEVRFKGAGSAAQGQGVRAGVAYQLEDGNIVYIPETGAAPASASAGGAGGAATPAPAKP